MFWTVPWRPPWNSRFLMSNVPWNHSPQNIHLTCLLFLLKNNIKRKKIFFAWNNPISFTCSTENRYEQRSLKCKHVKYFAPQKKKILSNQSIWLNDRYMNFSINSKNWVRILFYQDNFILPKSLSSNSLFTFWKIFVWWPETYIIYLKNT